MRISFRNGDPDFRGFHLYGRIRITLDGVEQRKVIWADDKAGQLEAFVVGADDRVRVDPSAPWKPLTEIRSGKIRIEK